LPFEHRLELGDLGDGALTNPDAADLDDEVEACATCSRAGSSASPKSIT
jgi:hypothetical protein